MTTLVLATLAERARGSTITMPSAGNNNLAIVYSGSDDETNDVSVSRDGDVYLITDPGATAGITPDDPTAVSACAQPLLPADPPNSVRCDASLVRSLDFELGDGTDHLTILGSAAPPVPPLPDEFPIFARGGAGNDTLTGGPGPEKLLGGDGIDTLVGGDGGDELFGGPDGDQLDGGAGDDLVQGEDGNDDIFCGPGDDHPCWGNAGDDKIDGGEGNDQLRGGTGDDQLRGGPGNDRLDFGWEVSDADDALGEDILDGGPGDDTLSGGPPRTSNDGNAPSSTLERDVLSGGDGIDTSDFSARTSSLKIDLDGRADDGEPGEHDNVQPNVERVIGGSDNDTLTASGADNFLDGRDGDDRLNGGAGADTLDGGANNPGSDTLIGGDGSDTMNGRAGDDSLDGGQGVDSLSGGGGTDKLDGGSGTDTLEGGAGGDALDGGPGNDLLNGAETDLIGADGDDKVDGGAGMDLLLGDDGDDVLDGGSGPDQIYGGGGKDTVTYENRSSPVKVTLDGVADDGEKNENDNVAPNVEIVLGGTVADTLSGDGDANTLDGGPGEDLVVGNAGHDRLAGGNASDLVRARDGDADVVTCGDDGDLAIVDRRDTVRDCETVDRGGKRRLVVGRSALVNPTQPQFGLRLPDARRFFSLTEAVKIPIASTIDPQAGEVKVATARNRAGRRQEISVSAGVFSVRQTAGRQPVTELRLRGGSFRKCRRSSTGRGMADVVADQPVRRLVTRTDKRRGKSRVRGRYSIAADYGTAWLTEDRCDGTLTRVESGAVRVHDLVRDRFITVRAGESYLAHPR